MCLNTKDEKIRWKWGVGYKAFGLDPTGTVYAGHSRGVKQYLVENEWLHDEANILLETETYSIGYSSRYETGFHLCRTWTDADILIAKLSWDRAVVRKVSFKKVTATGLQRGIDCIVARSIKLLSETGS